MNANLLEILEKSREQYLNTPGMEQVDRTSYLWPTILLLARDAFESGFKAGVKAMESERETHP